MDDIFNRLKTSTFRNKFYLKKVEKDYLINKGINTIMEHAQEFIKNRLVPANPKNDGKQTPMKGHPVFIAQHATAICCRSCLYKWYNIPTNVELTTQQQIYILSIIKNWLEKQI